MFLLFVKPLLVFLICLILSLTPVKTSAAETDLWTRVDDYGDNYDDFYSETESELAFGLFDSDSLYTEDTALTESDLAEPSMEEAAPSDPGMNEPEASDETADPAAVPVSSGIDTVLLIDISGSMVRSDPNHLTLQAAKGLAEELAAEKGSRIAIVPFSDMPGDILPLTELNSEDDVSSVEKWISALTYTNRDTDIGLAMSKAWDILSKDQTGAHQSILLLTDGAIDLPKAEDEESAEKESLTNALVTAERARKSGCIIETLTLSGSEASDTNLMTYLAERTGGKTHSVASADELPALFTDISKRLISAFREADQKKAAEPEKQKAETETESETMTETETETDAYLMLSGAVDGPVTIKGLYPTLGTASIDLSHLFSSSDSSSYISYGAFSEDNTVASCRTQDSLLTVSGVHNGTTLITAYAALEDGSRKETTFTLSIASLIPGKSELLLILSAAAVLLSSVLGFLYFKNGLPARKPSGPRVHHSKSKTIRGSLSWYVRSEGEHVFGIPAQRSVSLSSFTGRVKLSEIMQDESLEGAALNRVYLEGTENGIRVVSRSRAIAVQAGDGQLGSEITLSKAGRFRVYCETQRGKTAIIALYLREGKKGYGQRFSTDEDDERTHLLAS